MATSPTDTLTFTPIDHDGRPAWLTSDGRILPRIAGGSDDGSTGGDGGTGDGGGDSTGGAGEGASGQGSGSSEPGEAATNGDHGGTGDGPKLSQAEVDAIVQKRLGEARKSWERDAKTAADRAQMDEAERLKAEKADAEAAAQTATTKANERLVKADAKIAAQAAGANPKRIDALLRLVDLTDITVDDDGNVDTKALQAAITKGLDEYPEFKAGEGGKGGPSGGDFNGDSSRTWTRDEISKLSDAEFDKHKDEIQAAVAAGKVA